MDRAATLALARSVHRLLAKTGQDIVRVDAGRTPLSVADAERYLLHEDGFLRVPVLVLGDLVVRGYTDDLYREALADAGQA